jgi:hypothetical protein
MYSCSLLLDFFKKNILDVMVNENINLSEDKVGRPPFLSKGYRL